MVGKNSSMKKLKEIIEFSDSILFLYKRNLFDDLITNLLSSLDGVKLIINVGKRSTYYMRILELSGLDIEKVFFIDCVSKGEKKEQVIISADPSDLTTISLAITQFLSVMPGKKHVIIDDINALKMYNNQQTVARFINFLINKVVSYGAKIITLSYREDKSLINKISPFFDAVVEIK